MYVPKRYRVEDSNEIISFIRGNPFGTLVCFDGEKPVATHIPFELEMRDEKIYLSGHVAYGNPQWKLFHADAIVLVMFQGPHTYISPSWYAQANVPTWNYTAVHCYGHVRIVDGGELRETLKVMMNRYESNREQGVLWDTLPDDYVDRQIKGIVGFEMKVESIEAAYKMSQNRTDDDFANVVTRLQETGDPNDRAVSEVMRKVRP